MRRHDLSLAGLTDNVGDPVGTAKYEAFGGVRSSSGSSSVFGFTGELTDPTTGFVHLRARDYNTATGRFTSMDTVQPNAPGTQGYNRYAYVANNPATWTDPSGHSTSNADWCSRFFTSMWAIGTAVAASGKLIGKHKYGVYYTGIVATYNGVVAETALLNWFPELRSIGGDIFQESLQFGTWAILILIAGVPHISTFQFSMILLAGVLVLLVAALLEWSTLFVEWTFGMQGLCNRLAGNPDPPTSRGPQSPRTVDDARDVNDALPRVPNAPIPRTGQPPVHGPA